MAKLRSIASDLKLESEGSWRTFPGTDIRCKIARTGNPDYERHTRSLRMSRKVQSAEDGTLTEREAREEIAPAVAKHILKDWMNVQGDDGNEINFSEAEALKILLNPEYNDFYTWILRCAQDEKAFRVKVEEAGKGNS